MPPNPAFTTWAEPLGFEMFMLSFAKRLENKRNNDANWIYILIAYCSQFTYQVTKGL